jgi:hypothetical protein
MQPTSKVVPFDTQIELPSTIIVPQQTADLLKTWQLKAVVLRHPALTSKHQLVELERRVQPRVHIHRQGCGATRHDRAGKISRIEVSVKLYVQVPGAYQVTQTPQAFAVRRLEGGKETRLGPSLAGDFRPSWPIYEMPTPRRLLPVQTDDADRAATW